MIRVLYITGHGKGGSNVSLKNSILGLLKKDIKAWVVVPDRETKTYFESFNVPVEQIHFEADYWPFLNNPYDYLKFIPRLLIKVFKNTYARQKLRGIVSRFNPDIIHTNISTIQLGCKIARRMNIQHVWHIREYNTQDFGYKPIPTLRSLKHKLSDSYSIAISKDIFSFYNLSHDRCRIIYNGVMATNDIPPRLENKGFFLYVGGITQGKGVDNLVSAFVQFLKKKPHYTLLLAGSGPSYFVDRLKRFVSANQLQDNISFLGRSEDVYTLMASARALIVPSLSEAFGRITAEAMFCHCPVVGYNNAGTKEQFDNGLLLTNNEIGYRYNSEEELINILSLLTDSDFNTDDIVNRAYNTAIKLYSIESNVENIYNFYREILIKD